MGEQRPMDTLRGLATSLVTRTERRLWSVPDRYDCSFELHGFVVEGDETQPQLDLYEGYWAAGMRGTTMTHVGRFVRRVLLRRPSQVPTRVRWLWWMLAASGLVAVAVAGWIALTVDEHDLWFQVAKGAVALVLPIVTAWLCTSLGDVARFVDSHPDNIEVRLATRNAIVGLLDKLHDGNRYQRVVVIGHSLGGLVAYDAVRLLWARRTRDWNAAEVDDTDVAAAAVVLATTDDVATRRAFDTARGGIFRRISEADSQWLISDLITVGSPIAYPELFLATTADMLAARITEREVPTCPPTLADPPTPPERQDVAAPTFRYASKRSADFQVFHHAAMFCATRWTNVYAAGDFVGGPVKPPLGAGVQNIRLRHVGGPPAHQADARPGDVGIEVGEWDAGRWSAVPVRSHTRYWSEDDGTGLFRALVCRAPATADEQVAVPVAAGD